MLAVEQTTCLGPAAVLDVAEGRLRIDVSGKDVWAINAVAFPYQFSAGDIVLAIGQADVWYVVGVLKSTGSSTLTVPGDLSIRAPHGRINLAAAGGIELRSADIRVTARRLEVLADTAVERFREATRRVLEVFHVRARRLRTRVEGAYDVAAGRIVERAERDVKIDGSKINLG